ncbi:MAG: hypothetical protein RJQ08_13580 [Salinisphaeraceae bacterium]
MRMILAMTLALASSALWADCGRVGSSSIYCDNGSSYRSRDGGNTLYRNDGARFEQRGRSLDGPGGTSIRRYGNQTLGSDGSSGYIYGNGKYNTNDRHPVTDW